MRPFTVLALTAALLAGCGGGGEQANRPAAPGTPENPLRALPAEARASASTRLHEANGKPQPSLNEQPGYQALIERQAEKPRKRFSPCNLVSRTQAKAIVGEAFQAPVEAPQGPTCIYRSQSGEDFITLAMQSAPFRAVTRDLADPERLAVSGRTALCGTAGQQVLHLRVSASRVLSVTAPCDTARRFAATALERLQG